MVSKRETIIIAVIVSIALVSVIAIVAICKVRSSLVVTIATFLMMPLLLQIRTRLKADRHASGLESILPQHERIRRKSVNNTQTNNAQTTERAQKFRERAKFVTIGKPEFRYSEKIKSRGNSPKGGNRQSGPPSPTKRREAPLDYSLDNNFEVPSNSNLSQMEEGEIAVKAVNDDSPTRNSSATESTEMEEKNVDRNLLSYADAAAIASRSFYTGDKTSIVEKYRPSSLGSSTPTDPDEPGEINVGVWDVHDELYTVDIESSNRHN